MDNSANHTNRRLVGKSTRNNKSSLPDSDYLINSSLSYRCVLSSQLDSRKCLRDGPRCHNASGSKSHKTGQNTSQNTDQNTGFGKVHDTVNDTYQ